MKVSIIIPNYNGKEILKQNLPKVLDEIGNAETIVIDDASTDESLKTLESFTSKISILKNQRNLGFSPTINRGVKAAKGDIVVLLNSDVIPEKGFLMPLLYHFKDDKVFAVGCMDKSIENGKSVLRGRGIGRWKRGFMVHSRGEVDKASTLWVNGGSGAFRKSMWDKLGGFDELYSPFYWEDIDLSYRAVKSGFKVLFEPKSIVIHEHEKGAIKKKFSSVEIVTIAYRNQFIFVWKNVTDLNLQLSHLFWLPYHLLKACIRKDFSFLKGLYKAFRLLPRIIESSLKSQKMFVLKDGNIL